MTRRTIDGTILGYSKEERFGHVQGSDGLKYHFQAIDLTGNDPKPGDLVSLMPQTGRRATQVTIITRRARRVLQGTVKWFDSGKQSGFITGDDTVDYFVHQDDVIREEIVEGNRVEFSIGWRERGLRAEYVLKIADAPEDKPPDASATTGAPKVEQEPPQSEEPREQPRSPAVNTAETDIDRMALLQKIGLLLTESWELLWNGQVRLRYKWLPALGGLYVLSPLDLIPEGLFGFIGLADDAVILLGSLWLFRKMATQWLAQQAETIEEEPTVVEDEERAAGDCGTPDGCLHADEVIPGVYVVDIE